MSALKPPAAAGLSLEYAGASDTGRQRQNNEDALLIDAEAGLAVLADGMGGYNAGEIASQMAVDRIGSLLLPWLHGPGRQAAADEVAQRLRAAIAEANQAILHAAQQHAAWAGMGTTVVVAVLRPEGVQLGHVGDSRAYRWGAEGLRPLSRDHSLLQEQLDAGLIRPDQARDAAHRNLVTRALGVAPAVEADLAWHPLRPGEGLLLCSDGLSDMLDDPEIEALLPAAGEALPACAARLIDAANAAGGRDNISLVMIRVAGAPVPRRRWWDRRGR